MYRSHRKVDSSERVKRGFCPLRCDWLESDSNIHACALIKQTITLNSCPLSDRSSASDYKDGIKIRRKQL